MEKEAFEAPCAVERQLKENDSLMQEICTALHRYNPAFIMTDARGSSDHAATYAKYIFETYLGLVTASAAPSVFTLYKSRLDVKKCLVVAISQSGGSPDICEIVEETRRGGAFTVAIVNDIDSPLAKLAEYVIPLHAGEEKAIAATKSYITSLTAIVHFVATYLQDTRLLQCLHLLPTALASALETDWSPAKQLLLDVKDTLVIGRGYSFPVAQEAALKFKETMALHAEAFSGAEVLHGPFALVKHDYPILLFTQNDISLEGMIQLAKKIKMLGAKTIVTAPQAMLPQEKISSIASLLLNLPPSLHPLCDPIMTIQAFYPMVAALAVERGYDPDSPDNLKKITETT